MKPSPGLILPVTATLSTVPLTPPEPCPWELPCPDPAEYDAILKMDWLVEDWFEVPDIVLWNGEPGIGKSVITLGAALSLAAGLPILNFWPHPHPDKPFKVAILDLENRGIPITRRCIRLAKSLGIDLSTIWGKTFKVYSLRGFGLFDNHVISTSVLNSLLDFQPNLCLLDTLMTATTEDDLSPLSGVKFVRDRLMSWGRKLDCGWWALGHVKKADPSLSKNILIGNQDMALGGGFVGTADALVLLQKDANGQVIITNPKQRHTVNGGRYYAEIDDEGSDTGPLHVRMSDIPFVLPEGDAELLAALSALLPLPQPQVCAFISSQMGYGDRQARRMVKAWTDQGLLGRARGAPSGDGRPPHIVTRPDPLRKLI